MALKLNSTYECTEYPGYTGKIIKLDSQLLVIEILSHPHCPPGGVSFPGIGDPFTVRAVTFQEFEAVWKEIVPTATSAPDTFDACSKCNYPYSYGGPAICKSCELWKVVGT